MECNWQPFSIGIPPYKGVLFDLPAVVVSARSTISRPGVSDRIRIKGGDFFSRFQPVRMYMSCDISSMVGRLRKPLPSYANVGKLWHLMGESSSLRWWSRPETRLALANGSTL